MFCGEVPTLFQNFKCWIKKINYSCKLSPVKPHEVRSKTKHTQRLCSKSWHQNNANWVRKFRSRRRNETSKIQEHKISFTTLHRKTQEQVFVACLSPLFRLKRKFCKRFYHWVDTNILQEVPPLIWNWNFAKGSPTDTSLTLSPSQFLDMPNQSIKWNICLRVATV